MAISLRDRLYLFVKQFPTDHEFLLGFFAIATAAGLTVGGLAYWLWPAGVWPRSKPEPPVVVVLPDLPIAISFREAFDKKGLVAKFQNKSDKHFALPVVLTNRELLQRRTKTLELGPWQSAEIGWYEGWNFVTGEFITVQHADYKPLSMSVP